MVRCSRLATVPLIVFALATVFAGGVTAAEEPTGATSGVIDAVATPELDLDAARRVESFEIAAGDATVRLVDGWIAPLRPVRGRVLEFVFAGTATVIVDPPNVVEAQQLELFTGSRRLVATTEALGLAIGSPDVVARLLADGEAPDDGARARLAAVFEAWSDSPERRALQSSLVRVALDDQGARRFAAAWCPSGSPAPFVLAHDPWEAESLSVSRFVPADLDVMDEVRLGAYVRRAQRQGRFLGLDLEEAGQWDTWLSAVPRDGAGNDVRGHAGFEPVRYEIDATLDTADGRIEGMAAVDLLVERDGARVATGWLHSDLEIAAVRDGDGNDLEWFQDGGGLAVTLPEPLRFGATLRLEIDYGGVILDEYQKGIFVNASTIGWHPHFGITDRATYRTTLRWPKRFDLFASGEVVDSGTDDNGRRYETREVGVRVDAVSFEIGDFDVREAKAGDLDLVVAFSKASGSVDRQGRELLVEALRSSLEFYIKEFGPLPLERMTVVTLPRSYSQGLFGFLTVSHQLIWRSSYDRYSLWSLIQDIEGTRTVRMQGIVSHEIAHQWWGNMVGFRSYRDQWLTEALADWSSLRYVRTVDELGIVNDVVHGNAWRRALDGSTPSGRDVALLGPVVMGQRLDSTAGSGYQPIVYDKGAAVFRMLGTMLGEEPLAQMLGSLAQAVDFRVIDTETFLASLEKMSGADLDPFAERFVYGIGVPQVIYSYDIRQDGQGWIIDGVADVLPPIFERWALERTETGWATRRIRRSDTEEETVELVVPFQILTDGSGDERTATGLGGRMAVRGPRTEFSVPLDEKPGRFWLDQRGSVLAEFLDATERPKSALRQRALLETDLAASAEHYRRSLDAALIGEGFDTPGRKELERRTALVDAWTHIGLARLALDDGRPDAAETEIDTALEIVPRLDRERYETTVTYLRARIDLLRGDSKSAWQSFSKAVALDMRLEEGFTAGDTLQKRKLGEGRTGDGEDYALLAAAAFETGRLDVAARAAEEAAGRGADVAALVEALRAADSDVSPPPRAALPGRRP